MIAKIKGQLVTFAPDRGPDGATALSSRQTGRAKCSGSTGARGPPKSHHMDRRAATIIALLTERDPDQMLTTVETAELLGCSVSFLEIGRIRGYGPPAHKITPRMLRYRRGDVLAWVRERAEANASKHTAV